MLVALLAVTALGAANAEKIQFSNIRFEPGDQWSVAQQAPNMVLRPTNDAIKAQAKITIEPASPFSGTIDQGLDAAWRAALGGRSVNGDISKEEERDVQGGGKLLLQAAAVRPEGGLVVAVVKAGNKLTKLVLSADTDIAFQLAVVFAGGLLLSIEVVSETPPPSGAGGGGPGPLGPDPSEEFDWDGPDWIEYGVYDHDCRDMGQEFDELVRENDGVIGSVQPRTVTYADALAAARKILADPNAKKQYDDLGKAGSKDTPGLFVASAAARMMQGDPFGSLAHMLAGVNAAPNDPDILFNLASVLSQIGMPNESLAVLKKLSELNKKPVLSVGLKPDTTIAYLTGYNEMLRGKLSEASAKLGAAAADPFLSEANLCLALIRASQGGNGKLTYQKAAFRFDVPKYVFCSSEEEPRRPPVDKMFDCSKGTRPNLSDFRHPKNWQDLLKWMEEFAPRRAKEIISKTEALSARVMANPRPVPQDTPYGQWAERISNLMEGLDENEPLILKMQEIVDASEADVKRAADIHVKRLMEKLQELMIPVEGRHDCPIAKDAINQCLNNMRPYLAHWETVQRRYATTWHRMATGINAHVGKNPWHACNAASIASNINGLDSTIFLSVHVTYGAIAVALAAIEEKCKEPGGEADGTVGATPDGPECPPGMNGLGFKYSFDIGSKGPKLGFKVDCEKFTVDIDYPLAKVGSGPLAEFGVGGFAQLEMSHKGDWAIFAGAKGSISSSGLGVSEKAGIYVKGNAAEGIKDLGGRVSVEASGKGSEFSVTKSDTMDFSILPTPKAPALGPGLKSFPNR